MTTYTLGSVTHIAMELDPNGRHAARLANKIERAMAGSNVAIAIDTLAFMLAKELITAPPPTRTAVTDDVLDAIRHVVRESLN